MRLISPILRRVVYPGLHRSGYLRHRSRSFPAVLTYHGVLPDGYQVVDRHLDGNLLSANALHRQLQFWKANYEVISPEDFLAYSHGNVALPSRAVLLTCDDGLRNHLTHMLPILKAANLKCLFFVTGASLGETAKMLWHDRLYLLILAAPEEFRLELGELELRETVCGLSAKRVIWWKLVELLSASGVDERSQTMHRIRQQVKLPDGWDAEYYENPVLGQRFLTLRGCELRELMAAGMSIGAHTTSHSRLSRLPDVLAQREISENRQELEKVVGRDVWALAYPFGDKDSVSARQFDFARQSGFRCAFLNAESVAASHCWFALPRVHITEGMGLAELEAHISGFHPLLQQLLT